MIVKNFNLVSEFSDYINEVLKKTYNNNEGFIIAVAKDAKALNSKLLEMKNKNSVHIKRRQPLRCLFV